MNKQSCVKLLAFYLPQFHPIPENDRWWGNGFTEWNHVSKAKPLFPGHYQPHGPGELGFYDLRSPEVREKQALLARQYGIDGFCYYHYWFRGRKLLQQPFEEVLSSGRPDLPFCLCWANENWTRAWDGRERSVLIAQEYSEEDDLAHIRSLLPAFADRRYIKIDQKPFFLVYRAEALPDPVRTVALWRSEAKKAGFKDLYLACVEGFLKDKDPGEMGFDAAVEFAPDWRILKRSFFPAPWHGFSALWQKFLFALKKNIIVDYQEMVTYMLRKHEVSYKRFRCVAPSFDNSPRRARGAAIFTGSEPKQYQKWLEAVIHRTVEKFEREEKIVFINAWNEWGEGCHLEPDVRYGRAWLEATRLARQAE